MQVLDGADARQAAAEGCATAARTVGLHPTDLEWVRHGERAVLRMNGGQVIARVERPGVGRADAAREIAITRWLSANGIPVTQPLPVDQPVVEDGVVVTFWHGLTGGPGTSAQLGTLLRRIHALHPPAELSQPARPFLRLRTRIAQATGLDEADRAVLDDVLTTTVAAYDALAERMTPGFVHGDAACHNVLSTADGPVVFDLEYAGWGHREWDLAQTATYRDLDWVSETDYRDFERAYGRDVREFDGYPILRRARLLRELTGLARRIAATHDPALQAEVHRRVADLASDGPPGRWLHHPPSDDRRGGPR
jgi:Ser/Thr protein kinase RdoA (MazF antagonist)